MSQLSIEREHLEKADGHIAGGERRLLAHQTLIERLRASGQDTAEAERLLANLQDTLGLWTEHRDLIVRAIARLEALRVA